MLQGMIALQCHGKTLNHLMQTHIRVDGIHAALLGGRFLIEMGLHADYAILLVDLKVFNPGMVGAEDVDFAKSR